MNSCITCRKTIRSDRQYVSCGLCKKIAHRACTDIKRCEFQSAQRKSKTVEWHCNTCWYNIQHNVSRCQCDYCTQRRIDAISFEIPEYERSDFSMILSVRDDTVSSMDATQVLSPVRDPNASIPAYEPRPGMHVSSWEQQQLASRLNGIQSEETRPSSIPRSEQVSSVLNDSSSLNVDQSGPSWIQPNATDITINNTSVDIRCYREPIVSATPPKVNFIVTTDGARKGGVIITANPYGWKYYSENAKLGRYFVCSVRSCKGRLTVPDISDTSRFKMTGYHTCAPNISAQLNIDLSQKVKTLANQEPYTNASTIAKKAIDEIIPNSPSQPLTGLTSIQNLCKQGNRARQDIRETPPRDMNDLLTMQFCKEQFPEHFFRWDITVSNGSEERRHVFFATQKQMTYLAMATEWRIDSTFGVMEWTGK